MPSAKPPPSKATKIEIGDVVVTLGPIRGPAMRVIGFDAWTGGASVGPTAKVESLRRDEQDPSKAAWTAEFLLASLRVLPEGHYATTSPNVAFD